ncbi:CPBP family intramembrane glutamic endopeptidase [Flavihumibacter sp.]|uniref:CPBP family intramembrane glutamic endopeptidase n=1 Tax=Flavihumibacter sp. TaxID=1913981 RepID=UPI002FC6E3E5|nr:CPBP family intramembrane metalloprotease [Flavihumibacter sediminis]
MEALEEANLKSCSYCGSEIGENEYICPNCGRATVPEEEYEGAHETFRLLVVVFFSINLIACLLFNFWPPAAQGLTGLVVVDLFLFFCAILFSYIMRRDILPLLHWNNFKWWKVIVLMIFAITSAILVNYGVKWINRFIFERELFYYSSFKHLANPKTAMILLIAVIPAISEELAYRGIIQAGLLKFMHGRHAVVLTALLFAIIHMSLISFFWLLPFALFLGWLRQREQTLWYGILVHFCFNATTCLLELYSLDLL